MHFKLLFLIKIVFGNVCDNPGKIFSKKKSKILKFKNQFWQDDLVNHVQG